MNSPPKVIFGDLADKYKKKIAAKKRGPGLHQVAVRNFVIAKPTKNPDVATTHFSGIQFKATEILASPSITTASSTSSPCSVGYSTPTSSLGVSESTIATTPRSILTNRVSTNLEGSQQPQTSANPITYNKKLWESNAQLQSLITSVSPLSIIPASAKGNSPLPKSPRKKRLTDLIPISEFGQSNAQVGIECNHRADATKARSTSPLKSRSRNDSSIRRSPRAKRRTDIEDDGYSHQSPGSNEKSKQASGMEKKSPVKFAEECARIGEDISKNVLNEVNENKLMGNTRKKRKKVATSMKTQKNHVVFGKICTDTSDMDFAAEILSQIVDEYLKSDQMKTARNEIMQFQNEATLLLRASSQNKSISGYYTSPSGHSDDRSLPPLWADGPEVCSQRKINSEVILDKEHEWKQKMIESANQQLSNLDALLRIVRMAGDDNGPRDGIEGLIKTVSERCGKRRSDLRPFGQGRPSGEEATTYRGMVTRLREINNMLESFAERSSHRARLH